MIGITELLPLWNHQKEDFVRFILPADVKNLRSKREKKERKRRSRRYVRELASIKAPCLESPNTACLRSYPRAIIFSSTYRYPDYDFLTCRPVLECNLSILHRIRPARRDDLS